MQLKLDNSDHTRRKGKSPYRQKIKRWVEGNGGKQANLDLLRQLKNTSIADELIREPKDAPGVVRVTMPKQKILRDSLEEKLPVQSKDQAI